MKEINDWVAQETGGKVQRLLAKAPRNPGVITVSAAYFKGTSQFPESSDCQSRRFERKARWLVLWFERQSAASCCWRFSTGLFSHSVSQQVQDPAEDAWTSITTVSVCKQGSGWLGSVRVEWWRTFKWMAGHLSAFPWCNRITTLWRWVPTQIWAAQWVLSPLEHVIRMWPLNKIEMY